MVQNRVCPFCWRCVIQCKSWFIFGIATIPLIVIIIINLLRILLLGYYRHYPGACFVLTNVQMNCEIICSLYLSFMKMYNL